VVITMLATPQALQHVLFAGDGAAGALAPGQRLIDMSTVGAGQADFAQVQPLLAPLGTVHHVGGSGAGAATKVCVSDTWNVMPVVSRRREQTRRDDQEKLETSRTR
jgi:3-hydroxyisobutyrate dehydrogenase